MQSKNRADCVSLIQKGEWSVFNRLGIWTSTLLYKRSAVYLHNLLCLLENENQNKPGSF